MYDYQSTSGKANSGLIVIHNEERIMHCLACRVNLQGMNWSGLRGGTNGRSFSVHMRAALAQADKNDVDVDGMMG
jgi:hypothetical protein